MRAGEGLTSPQAGPLFLRGAVQLGLEVTDPEVEVVVETVVEATSIKQTGFGSVLSCLNSATNLLATLCFMKERDVCQGQAVAWRTACEAL